MMALRPMITRRRRQRPHGVRRAFTLIELLTTVTVLAAVGSVASVTLMAAIDTYVAAGTRSQLHAELSIALDRIDRELRKMAIEGGALAPDINLINSASITWNGNFSLTRVGDELRFIENGGPSRMMLDNVTAFSVVAYDQSNAALPVPLNDVQADVARRLLVSVTISRAGVTEMLRTKIFLRCTMDGA